MRAEREEERERDTHTERKRELERVVEGDMNLTERWGGKQKGGEKKREK